MAHERQVELYVYDTSQGTARDMSMSILGIQIDAIYHTSIVIGDREYYYGNGIHCSPPGRTHFGSPMEIMLLGFTSFSDDILQECIESMRAEYSPEAYDLFHHNCNNFTADFAMFLCGVSIPEKIKNLPQDVLNTPFGQFLRPTAGQQPLPITNNYQPESAPPATSGKVKNITSMAIFEQELKCAKCAVVFFTSAGCPPCRMVYPYFEELSSEHGEKATFIKVDVSVAQTIGSAYQITATPAFMSWCRGKKLDDWKGGSPTELKKYVAMLLNETYPSHPHANLSMAAALSLSWEISKNPPIFNKVPPLDKVTARLGPVVEDGAVKSLIEFLKNRNSGGPVDTSVPDQSKWATFMQQAVAEHPMDTLIPIFDLFRASFVDQRVSSWFVDESECATIKTMVSHVTREDAPYAIRVVTIQAMCNLFSSTIFSQKLLSAELIQHVINLIAIFVLDNEHKNIRVSTSALSVLISIYIQRERSTNNREVLRNEVLVELAVCIMEGLKEEKESLDAMDSLTLSLALIYYSHPSGSELKDLFAALEVGETLKEKIQHRRLTSRNAELYVEVAALLSA